MCCFKTGITRLISKELTESPIISPFPSFMEFINLHFILMYHIEHSVKVFLLTSGNNKLSVTPNVPRLAFNPYFHVFSITYVNFIEFIFTFFILHIVQEEMNFLIFIFKDAHRLVFFDQINCSSSYNTL